LYNLPAASTKSALADLIHIIGCYIASFFEFSLGFKNCYADLAQCRCVNVGDLRIPSVWNEPGKQHSFCVRIYVDSPGSASDSSIVVARLFLIWDTRAANKWKAWKCAKLALFSPMTHVSPNYFLRLWNDYVSQNDVPWGNKRSRSIEMSCLNHPDAASKSSHALQASDAADGADPLPLDPTETDPDTIRLYTLVREQSLL
jgi:hypothetical protein